MSELTRMAVALNLCRESGIRIDEIRVSPFPLIGHVRMSHDEYHDQHPTAKCGMSCHWYAEEKRQGLA